MARSASIYTQPCKRYGQKDITFFRHQALLPTMGSRPPIFAWAKACAMPNSLRTAYLFQCKDDDLYAVSIDSTGANIPRAPCTDGWLFCEEFELGRHASVPAPVMAEPILKGILDQGYYVWRGWSGSSRRPDR